MAGAETWVGYMFTNKLSGFTDSNGIFAASHTSMLRLRSRSLSAKLVIILIVKNMIWVIRPNIPWLNGIQ